MRCSFNPYVAIPVPVQDMKLLYIDIGRWKPLKSKWMSWTDPTGPINVNSVDYDSECHVHFPLMDVATNNERWMVFGPEFGLPLHSYMCTNRSLVQGAFKRALQLRDVNNPMNFPGGVHQPELYHNFLVNNQYNSVTPGGVLHPKYNKFFEFFGQNWKQVVEEEKLRNAWVDQPHVKKKLRQRIREKRLSRRKGYNMYKYRETYTDYKSKPGETLNWGKQLRAIGELGDESAFLSGPFVDYMKKIMAKPFVYRGSMCVFVPGPKKEEMCAAIKTLLGSSRYRLVHIFFSDDCVIGMRCRDGVYWCNGDFSACDSSMYEPVIQFLERLCSFDPVLRRTFKKDMRGLSQPLRLIDLLDPHPNPKRKKFVQFNLRPGQYFMYSGSAWTTTLNNCFQLILFEAMASSVARRLPLISQAKSRIERAGESVGAILKCVDCKYLEDIQFLKHSFTQIGSDIHAWVNLSLHFKLGFTQSIIPNTHTKSGKFRDFNASVIEGRKTWGNHCVYDAWRNSKACGKVSEKHKNIIDILQQQYRTSGGDSVRIPTESLARRYRCSTAQLLELCEFIRDADVGDRILHPLVRKMWEVDYGFTPPPGGFNTVNTSIAHQNIQVRVSNNRTYKTRPYEDTIIYNYYNRRG